MGFGFVAQRFIQLLLKQKFLLDPRGNPSWIIAGIATAHHGLAVDPDGINPDQALQAARDNALPDLHSRDIRPSLPSTFSFLETAINSLDSTENSTGLVVVENTPLGTLDGQPGVDHVRAALKLGAHVITANKGPAAFAHRELVDLARRKKAQVPLRRLGSRWTSGVQFFSPPATNRTSENVFVELLTPQQTTFCPRWKMARRWKKR